MTTNKLQKNVYWIIAGFVNLGIFLLHLIGGQLELVNPLLNSNLSKVVISQWTGAWHMVSIVILATSTVLLLAGFNKKYQENLELIKFCGYLNFAFCIPFICASLYFDLFVSQWILFLPVALFANIGIKKRVALN